MEGQEGREEQDRGPEEKAGPQNGQPGEKPGPKIPVEMMQQISEYLPMVESMAKAMLAQIQNVSAKAQELETRVVALEEHANQLTAMFQDPQFYSSLREAILGGVAAPASQPSAPVSISLGAPGNGGGGGGFGGGDALEWMKTFAMMMSHANSAAPVGGAGDGLSQGVQMLGQMFKIFTEFQKTALHGIRDMYGSLGDRPARGRGPKHLLEEEDEE